jgi:hypothetical protein
LAITSSVPVNLNLLPGVEPGDEVIAGTGEFAGRVVFAWLGLGGDVAVVG